LQLLKKFFQLYPQYSSYDVNDSSPFWVTQSKR
jgi:hypothetical protein